MSDKYWWDLVNSCDTVSDVCRTRRTLEEQHGPNAVLRSELLKHLENIHGNILARDQGNCRDKLLKAAYDILSNINDSPYADALSVTAVWDEAECDGYCLLEELEDELSI